MNYFFLLLIPVLFLAPGVAFGEIEKGYNYDREFLYTQGSTDYYKFTSHPERIVNYTNAEGIDIYSDYRVSEDANTIQVETVHGSVSLDKNTCGFSFFNDGYITEGEDPLFTDSIIARRATNDTDNWIDINQINNASCVAFWDDTLKELTARKAHSVGLMEYKYIFKIPIWKTQLEVTNLSALTDQKFGFTQTFDLNRDTITWGGNEKNLDNFDNSTFNRTFLENNESKLMQLMNGYNYDLSLAFDYLNAVTTYDTGLNKSKLAFDFTLNSQILSPSQTLIIDPTFTDSAPADDGFERELDDDDLCGNAGSNVSTSNTGTTANAAQWFSNTHDCHYAYFEYDITSIPDSALILDVDFDFEIVYKTGAARDCVYVGLDSQPSVTNSQNLITAIRGDETLLTDSSCTVVGSYSIDMGTTADTYVSDSLVRDWIALGVKLTPETDNNQDNVNQFAQQTHATADPPTITIVYSTSAFSDAVTDLHIQNYNNGESLELDWTTPADNGLTIIGYQINYTLSHTGDPTTVLVNDTGTTTTEYTVSSLTPDSLYSFRVGTWVNYPGSVNASGNMANTTTYYANPNLYDYNIIGDVIKINVTGLINSVGPGSFNVTDAKLYVNGTLENHNTSVWNGSAYTWSQGPNWYQMTTDDIYNITTTVTGQNDFWHSTTNITSAFVSRGYGPSYQTALDPTEGTVNYTFPSPNVIYVNRDKGGNVFSIECVYFTQSSAFFGDTSAGVWDNYSSTGYYQKNYAGFYYVTCYNDDELFTTTLSQNFSNALIPGLVIFDQLGGFMGAPSIILIIIAILSLGTGRNFPIILTIAVSVTGILYALELIEIDAGIFVALVIIAGISIFGIRKFY